MRGEAHDEWAALAQLLAQLLAAHTSTIPGAGTRDMANAALSTLAAAASSPVGSAETRCPLCHLHPMYQSPACRPKPAVPKHTAVLQQRQTAGILSCSALQQLPQLLAAARHATFQRVLMPLLLPCLALVMQHVMQEDSADGPQVRPFSTWTPCMLRVSSAQQPDHVERANNQHPLCLCAGAVGFQSNHRAVHLAPVKSLGSLCNHAWVLPSGAAGASGHSHICNTCKQRFSSLCRTWRRAAVHGRCWVGRAWHWSRQHPGSTLLPSTACSGPTCCDAWPRSWHRSYRYDMQKTGCRFVLDVVPLVDESSSLHQRQQRPPTLSQPLG